MLAFYQTIDIVDIKTPKDYTVYTVPMGYQETTDVQGLVDYVIENGIVKMDIDKLELTSSLKQLEGNYGRLDTITFFDPIEFELFCLFVSIESNDRGSIKN